MLVNNTVIYLEFKGLKMVKLKYIPLSSVRGNFLELERYIDILKSVLRRWSTRPLRVNGEFRVISEDQELYNALWALGPRLVPVAESYGNVEVEVSLSDLDFYHNVIGSTVRVYSSVVDLVARDVPTPIVRLKYLSDLGVRVWAKLEWYHPFSLSIKDRIAWFMLVNSIERGNLKSRVLYEATSTNTGLGLVGLANYYALKVRVYLPSTVQRCVDYLFMAMGADVVRKESPLTVSMIDSVLLEATRDGAVVLNQFENDLNFIVHLQYTAKEIDYQLRNAGIIPRAIIGGLGTSGHMSAISLYFKNRYSNVEVYGVQPTEGSTIPGLRRIETGMKWIRYSDLSGVEDISLEEAFNTILEVARSDGLLIGLSSGAVLSALRKLAEKGALKGDTVAIIPDHGVKYIEILESLVTKICPERPPHD
jgi:cysteine synthase/O-phosphoserine sulfhydrylase/cystathionine beta-synthase